MSGGQGLVHVLFLTGCWLTAAALSSKCGPCDEKSCPQLSFCAGEVLKDHCNCCAVCSSDLFQPHVRYTPAKRKDTACGKVRCPKFKVCMENFQGVPLCTCPSTFTCRHRKRREVCGTDGLTYPSRCHMRIDACNNGKRVKMLHKGACDGRDIGDQELRAQRRKKRKRHSKRHKDRDRAKRRRKRRLRKRKKKQLRQQRKARQARFMETFAHYKWF